MERQSRLLEGDTEASLLPFHFRYGIGMYSKLRRAQCLRSSHCEVHVMDKVYFLDTLRWLGCLTSPRPAFRARPFPVL
jgi:hypothetical protein